MLVGCDPEVPLVRNGNHVSAIGLIGGSKAAPLPVKYGALQEDNVMAEINIDPARSRVEFIRNVTEVMKQLQSKVSPNQILIKDWATYKDDQLRDEAAWIMGCDPDFNAWTMMENPAVELPPNSTGRPAGGHLHFGDFGVNTFKEALEVVRYADYRIALPLTVIPGFSARRQMYGKAGSFRMKPYGVEYRTPSNVWLKSEALIGWVYDASIEVMKNYKQLDSFVQRGLLPGQVQETINTNDSWQARRLCEMFHIPFPR